MGSSIGKFFGISPKGKQMNAADSATEDTIQGALDTQYGTPGTFGQRKLSAADAEKAMRAAGTLPAGWRLRESDSTSSGYRPTQASTKKMGAVRAGQIAAAVGTGGMSLAAQAAINAGLGAAGGGMGGGGIKGALLGGALGAAGPYVPGGATASLGRKVATQAGMGAGNTLAQGGSVKDALLGAGFGAAGAGASRIAPGLTSNALGQKAINFGVNTGLNTARTGQLDPLQTALSAGGNFLPDASRSLSTNPWAQRALNAGGTQALNVAGGGQFDPVQLGLGMIPRRAGGGPVDPNKPYVVGEEGPEVVVPKAPATVLPNSSSTVVPSTPAPLNRGPVAPAAALAAAPAAPAAQSNFWDTYGKPIATVGGIAGGMYAGKKAQEAAAVRSPEEQAAISGAMGPGGSAATAASLMQESRPYISKPASYYQTLLNGNRAAMAQAVAPARTALNESYRGAQSQLQQSGIRGAARDQLSGNLNRQQASQVAGLTTGVQPGAAAALAQLGQGLQGSAVPLYGSANNFYAQMLDSGLKNRAYAAGQGQQTGSEIGKMVADLGNVRLGGGGKGPQPPPAPPGVNLPPGAPGQPGVLTGPGGFTVPQPGVLGPPPVDVDYGEGDYDYSATPDYGDDGSNPYGYPQG